MYKTYSHDNGEIAFQSSGIFVTFHRNAQLDIYNAANTQKLKKRRFVFNVISGIVIGLLSLIFLAAGYGNFNLESLVGYMSVAFSIFIIWIIVQIYFDFIDSRRTLFISIEEIDQVRLYPSGRIEWVVNRHNHMDWRVQSNSNDTGSIYQDLLALYGVDKVKVPREWAPSTEGVHATLKGVNGSRVVLSESGLEVGRPWMTGKMELKEQRLPPALGRLKSFNMLKPDRNYFLMAYLVVFFLDFILQNSYITEAEDWSWLQQWIEFNDIARIALLYIPFLLLVSNRYRGSSKLWRGGLSFTVKAEDIHYVEITGNRIVFGLYYTKNKTVDFETNAQVFEDLEALENLNTQLTPVTF